MIKHESYFHQSQQQQNLPQAKTYLEHNCSIDVDRDPAFVRHTNLVCTIGPSSYSPEVLKDLLLKGMNIVRININSGPKEFLKEQIDKIRAIEATYKYNPCVGIALDITSPTVRTGIFNEHTENTMDLVDGAFITLNSDSEFRSKSTNKNIWIDTSYFPNFFQSIRRDDRIYIDEGLIWLIAKKVSDTSVYCLIESGGTIKGSRRVDLPRERCYSMQTEKQYFRDLEWAKNNDIDVVFTSYSENPNSLLKAKQILGDSTGLFMKIETKCSFRNLKESLQIADGVVICRGKLDLEINHEKIFKLQKNVIGYCNLMMKPVFVQGQLLDSMRYKPRPTRAEISDIANAVLDGADGLVLTVETAKGDYPRESLSILHKTCREAETSIFQSRKHLELKMTRERLNLSQTSVAHITALMAVEAASMGASAILIPTITGRSAELVASYRPACPVIAIVRRPKIARKCHFYRGIHPFVYEGKKVEDWSEDMDLRINAVIDVLKTRDFISVDDQIVVVNGKNPGIGSTNTVRTFKVPEKGHYLEVVKPPRLDHWAKAEDIA